MPPSLHLAWCHLCSSSLSLEGMPSPKHVRHPKCSARRMEVSVCKWVCCVVLAACHLPPCALATLKRCHHRIAGNRCLGTSSWLCPSKQTVISSKSSEVSLLVFNYDSSPSTALIASVMPRLQAGMVPAGWHAAAGTGRKKNRKNYRKQDFPPMFSFVRSMVITELALTVS